MFDTVLVANRGEIAVRIIRTLRRMGIRSVAVYSDDDATARHVREADTAVHLGPTPARQSYLSVDRLLDAAVRSGAQAVHPGYGFLAENADFLRACVTAGLVPVAPPISAVEAMGDKIRAKLAVSAAGVPVVPGRAEPGMSDADLVAAADEVGYPVLVKPSAGGGGKGMRLVHEPTELLAQLASARREAASSFGDDTLFLERFILRPRHIEVQVLADAHGTTVHLGERECSLQRRHQKVIEEAPSPLLDKAARERICRLGVATAEAVGYTGAGTVEFIVSSGREAEPFFMEMNTRLQVEHPVTEMITGLDLVEQQLLVASGEPLSFGQADIQLTGHAVEGRIYAEDPTRGFLPTGGQALLLREPAGDGVRVDSGLLQGERVGSTYDPMLSKVIAWGPDRATALARLDHALASFVTLGVVTNQAFLRALLRHPDVRGGRLDTGLLERSLDDLLLQDVPDAVYAAFALRQLLDAQPSGPVVDPWDMPSGWRMVGAHPLQWQVSGLDDLSRTVTATGPTGDCSIRVDDGEPFSASAVAVVDGLMLTVRGVTSMVLTAQDGAVTWAHLDGTSFRIAQRAPSRKDSGVSGHSGEIRSPMPGSVIAVFSREGEDVDAGAPVLVVEAMKMEHTLVAPFAGRVEGGLARVGQQVVVDQLVATISVQLY